MNHRIDRIWLLGGAVVTVLLVVASWFLVIQPKYSNTSSIRGQVSDGSVQLAKLKQRLAALDKQRKQLPALEAQLKSYQAALPSTADETSFLRQLQTSGTAVGVDVSSVTLGTPTQSEALPTIEEVPITLTADGPTAAVSKFLLRLQSTQARAVLVTSVSLTAGTNQDGTPNGQLTASIALTAFVSSTSATSSTGITTK
jgi:Tfp pilus assembly protein PilO